MRTFDLVVRKFPHMSPSSPPSRQPNKERPTQAQYAQHELSPLYSFHGDN